MDRRKFLGMTSVGAAAGRSLLSGTAKSVGPPSQTGPDSHFLHEGTAKDPYELTKGVGGRPNIFLITLDMVSPDFYLPSRPLSRELQLPNLHSLMNDGVFFENAFATVPLCSPSRASYLTGRYPYILGVRERAPAGLETELRPDDVIFPEYLKGVGYVTKHCGKCHVGTKKFIDAFGENDNAWDRWSPPIYDDENYLEYERRLGAKPQKYSKEIVLLQQDRKAAGNSVGGWIVQADGKPFPPEAQYTHYLVDCAVNKLADARMSPTTRGRPIYLQLDIFDPHQPFSIPDGFQTRERELRAVMTLPESYQKIRALDWNPMPDQPKIYDQYRKYWGLYDPKSLMDYRVANALQMEVADHALGRFVQALKEHGLYDESVIVVISDHGEMNGRWALIDKGVYLFPDVLRVPMVIKMSKSYGIAPRIVEIPVSLLDVAPTLLAAAGVKPDCRLDGRSLLEYIQGVESIADLDLIFSCAWHVGVNFACGIQKRYRNGDHYLFAYNLSSNVDELYDLNSIDAENLAQKPECTTIRKDLVNRLAESLKKDLRWRAQLDSLRNDRYYFDLPHTSGDQQRFV